MLFDDVPVLMLRPTPRPLLPEMMFRSTTLLPPIVLSDESVIATPWLKCVTSPFGIACVPAALRPMMLPLTALPAAELFEIETPPPMLPEITLPGPIVLFAPVRETP